jgi:hypothetical protein
MLPFLFQDPFHPLLYIWRELHSEEICNLYSSPNMDQIKEDDMGQACSMHRKDDKCIQNFVQKT